MGTLAQGASMGAASIFNLIGAGTQAAGDVASANGQAQAYLYQAQVSQNNAAILRANASNELVAGQYNESASKLRTGEVAAAGKTAAAASGLDVGIGSPVATAESTRTVGAMDAATMHFNAARQAYATQTEAGNADAQAELDKTAASNARLGGYAKAASTILGAASSTSSRYRTYQLGQPSGNTSLEGLY